MGWLGKTIKYLDPHTTAVNRYAKQVLHRKKKKWEEQLQNERYLTQSRVNNTVNKPINNQYKTQEIVSDMSDYNESIGKIFSEMNRYKKRYNYYTDELQSQAHEWGTAALGGEPGIYAKTASATAANVGYSPKGPKLFSYKNPEGRLKIDMPTLQQERIASNPNPENTVGVSSLIDMDPYLKNYYNRSQRQRY